MGASKIFFVLLVFASISRAAIDGPLRDPKQYDSSETQATSVSRVRTASVVAANYQLLAQDFPDLRKHDQESDSQWKSRIDRWLLTETPYMMTEHITTSTANTPIQAELENKKTAYRPKAYNRAHVLPVPGGLVDVKGTGMWGAHPGNKTDGLASLGEMIREYLFEQVVADVFRHSGINAHTIGNYAVLDLGFDVLHTDESKSRAGMILRQAHIRSKGFNSSVTREQGILVESTLRRYGLTSSGETMGGGFNFDYINIQGTGRQDVIEILDFGAFMGVEKFTRTWRSNGQGGMLDYAQPGDAKYVQPDPSVRVDLGMWGDFGSHDPKDDKPWRWSHELAQALAEGKAHRNDVDNHIRNFMKPVEDKLAHGGSCQTNYF